MQYLTPNNSVESHKPLHALWLADWLKDRNAIESWFSQANRQWLPPAYASVDIRHNDIKVAVVDTNLFSAGFNNLDETSLQHVIPALERVWSRHKLKAERILLIPERHTRNHFYTQSLIVLKQSIEATGAEVRIGFWEDASQPELTSAFKEQGWFLITKQGSQVGIGDWIPDFIFLNNDLSSGIPAVLQDISTPVIPPLELGWHTRLKSRHFELYQHTVNDFAQHLNIDSWPLQAEFQVVENIDFSQGVGIEALQDTCQQMFKKLTSTYHERGITRHPYLVIKPDRGTYGMGVMTIQDASELTQLNRKQRNKMSTIKDGISVHRVLIQEGISSAERWNNHVAESVLYMVDNEVVGKFYRFHPERDSQSCLNSPGMLCQPVALESEAPEVYLHTIVARLALVAAAREYESINQK